MRWRKGTTTNDDVIDRRGASGGGGRSPFPMGGGGMGGGRLPLPGGKGGAGIGGLILIALMAFVLPKLLGGGGGGFPIGDQVNALPGGVPAAAADEPAPPAGADPESDQVDFIRFVVGDVQDVWTQQFTSAGRTYERAKLVLFRDGVQTGCGPATSQVGPFYCPADSKVYIDIGFMEELQQRFSAQGDFAEAYIIAHEVGHHIQNLLGIDDQVRQQASQNPDARNDLSIRQELQADCLAGVWAHSAYSRDLTEKGDLEEALNAAAGVGDDRIQQQTQGRIDREGWTHGSAEQRSRWFKRGFDEGDPNSCDTFAVDEP